MHQRTNALLTALLAALPSAAPAAQERSERAAPQAATDAWTRGAGRGVGFGGALAAALADALGAARGAAFATDPALQSRLDVLAAATDQQLAGGPRWVLSQLRGAVSGYEVTERTDEPGGAVRVSVRARAAGVGQPSPRMVIELVDAGLSQWQLERFEEGGAGRPFDRRSGRFEGPELGEYLRRSGAVDVTAGPDSRLVPSHRAAVTWQPVTVRSQVDKPNRARPTKGPRPERLIGGAVAIALRIEDRAGGVKLLEEAFTVTADGLPALPADRRDAYVTALVDKANAEVSARIFFALQPPVVLRKWVGEGGAWHVEVRMSERVARSYRSFAAGVEGSLASPDWRHLAAATWVGGGAETSTFRLTSDVDAASLKAGVTQVRPVQ